MPVLPLEFYNRDTTKVARELLGKTLVHQLKNGTRISGRIVETEAYLGVIDLAAHTYGGRRTQRTQTMFMKAGHAYVYQIYGLHFCLNVVTRKQGTPEAVLIRAIEPLEGLSYMKKRRPAAKRDFDLTNGPGKVCAALGIDKSFDASLLDEAPLYIEEPAADALRNKRLQIIASPRIGVDYAKHAALWPLRFSISENSYVSKPQPWTKKRR